MEITTIQVDKETRKKLQLRKLELDLKNVDEVINEALASSYARTQKPIHDKEVKKKNADTKR